MLQGFQKCLPLELMKEPTFLQPTEGGWWVVTKDQRGAAPLTHLLFFPCGLHPHALNTTPPLPIVLAVQPALLHLPHWTDSVAPSLPNPRAPSLSSVSCRPHVACLNSSSPSRVFAQTILAPLPAAQEPDSQLHPGVTRSQPSVFDLQTLGPHCASATRRVKRAKTRGLPADPQPRVKVLEERNSPCPPPPQQPRTPQCNKGHFLIT